MVDKDKIMRLLQRHFKTIGTITISDEGLVSCTGNVELKRTPKLERLPVAFDSVDGNFVCWDNQLITLEGAPKKVDGDFWCFNNQLTTLEHAPQRVDGTFDCGFNQLTTLAHAPNSVGVDFNCSGNKLTSLEGLPVVPGTLYLSYNPTLPLLRCLLAKKVKFVTELQDKTIEDILNQYAGQGEAGAFACGAELATAGFKENARW